MNYLLDTNALTGLLKGHPTLHRRMRQHGVSALYIPVIATFELYYGAYNESRTQETLSRIDGIEFHTLHFDRDDARAAAEIRARLRSIGRPIGPYDVLIAGQALARGMTLVTRNTGEFSRVDGLRLEDWEA